MEHNSKRCFKIEDCWTPLAIRGMECQGWAYFRVDPPLRRLDWPEQAVAACTLREAEENGSPRADGRRN